MSVFDNLANGLEDQSTAVPMLAPGIHEFKIHSMEKKSNEAGTFEYIAIGLQLTSEAEDTDGNPISGAFVNTMIGLTENDYNSEEDIRRQVACFLVCFQGSREWDETFESYIGLEGSVKTRIKPEKGEYPEGVDVARNGYIPKG